MSPSGVYSHSCTLIPRALCEQAALWAQHASQAGTSVRGELTLSGYTAQRCKCKRERVNGYENSTRTIQAVERERLWLARAAEVREHRLHRRGALAAHHHSCDI